MICPSIRIAGLFAAFLAFTAFSASAEDLKLDVRLVWGTDLEQSPNPEHKPLDAATAKKLGIFKWKKYFMVNRKQVDVPSGGAKKVRLSPECEIEIRDLQGPMVEVNIYGKGKHVKKIVEKISREDLLTIAGDDKNDCAWFILIKEL